MKTNAEIMQEYFAAELRLLREGVQEFAERYPEQAGALNLNTAQDRDPYIERLLEGVAYLTAQIRQRVDDDIPDVCETLLQQLAPQFLQHFPSATILQFQPKSGQLQQPYVVPKNSSVMSKPIGEPNKKVSCEFRTIRDVKINPIHVADVDVSQLSTGGSLIKIKIQFDTVGQRNKLDLRALCFYLHGEMTLALQMYHALMGGVSKVQITFPEQPKLMPIIMGGQECVRAMPFSAENTLVPNHQNTVLGLQVVQEYFNFREKLLFVVLHGLEAVDFPVTCQQFDINIQTKMVFSKEQIITKDNFQLHCVPAINLFTSSAEPIQYSLRQNEYPLVIDINQSHAQVLYRVDQVTGIEHNTGKRHEYNAMTSFLHRQQPTDYFHTQQRNRGALYPTTFIMLSNKNSHKEQTLSCAITASNGHYPRRYLTENSVTEIKQDLPNFLGVKNLVRPSAMLLPVERENYRWQLLSHLSLSYQSFAELDNFKELLSSYNWTARQDNEHRIAGIQTIELRMLRKIYQGILFNGMQFVLTLQEECYLSSSDLYLFGAILHQFFCMTVGLNVFVETRVICHPSQQEFKWNSQ